MKIFCLIVLFCVLNVAFGWMMTKAGQSYGMSKIFMSVNDDFAALEKKLASRLATPEVTSAPEVKKTVTTTKSFLPTPHSTTTKPVAEKVVAKPVTAAKPAVNVATNKVVSVPTKVASTKTETVTKTTVAPPTATAASAGDFIAGIGLGLAPFVLIPVVAFNFAKKLVSQAKPLPGAVEAGKAPKVKPYSKSLKEGAKEGIEELLSTKSTTELNLSRKGAKIAIGSFTLAALLTGVSAFVPSGEEHHQSKKEVPVQVKKTEAVKVAPKVETKPAPKVEVKPAPKVEEKPVPKVEVKPTPKVEEKPAPKVEVKPAPKVEEKSAPKVEVKPAPAPEVKPAPKVEEKPAPKVEVKPAPKVEEKPAPKVEVKPAPAPEVKPAPKVEEKPAPKVEVKPASSPAAPSGDEGTQVYVPRIPKGMEPDVVDLDALKALRKIRN
eukprot:gene511-550_t